MTVAEIERYGGRKSPCRWQSRSEIYTLFQDSLNQRYRELSSGELHSFLTAAFALTDEHGLVNLLPGERMPSDFRELMMYRPSYCVIAAGIYACTHFRMADEPLMDHLKHLMDAAFQHGIVAHGFGGDKVRRDVLRILFQAGAKEFLAQYPDISEHFSGCIDHYLSILEHTATPDNPNGKWFHDAFDDLPCNTQMHQLLALWYKQANAVFVYGTLMKGQRANRIIASGRFAGHFVLDGYEMFSLGRFPGIWPGDGNVVGEVWFVDDETLDLLDEYESEGYLYRREQAPVSGPDGRLDAQVYVCMNKPEGTPIGSEWCTHEDDAVWYAAYGSSLSRERFRCYVEGGTCAENGKYYPGCRYKTLWSADELCSFPGRLYFGNHSKSWENGGVAFYSPKGSDRIQMRLYRITREQLADIQKQEGPSPRWYGNQVLLGLHRDGSPIYTLTCKGTNEKNSPCDAYRELIRTALMGCGMTASQVQQYLHRAERRR